MWAVAKRRQEFRRARQAGQRRIAMSRDVTCLAGRWMRKRLPSLRDFGARRFGSLGLASQAFAFRRFATSVNEAMCIDGRVFERFRSSPSHRLAAFGFAS